MGDIPFPRTYLRSTVYIENSFGNIGTGFTVGKKFSEDKKAIFIITNKHVLQNVERTKNADYIIVRFYKKDSTIDPKVKNIKIPLKSNEQFTNRVFLHPDESVDVAAILISDVLNIDKELDITVAYEDLFLTREKMKEEVIEAGEDVFILGYPAGIFSQENFLPIVKQGIIASSPREDLKLRLGNEVIKGKVFLVEAALFGGSSGSPVFIKPRWKVKIDPVTNQQLVQLGEGMPIYLLGIQSSAIESKEKIYTRILKEDSLPDKQNGMNGRANLASMVQKDKEGEYFILSKEVMLNIVFSAEYILDLFKEYDKRFKEELTKLHNI